ncbi:hypothetical protein A6R68_12020, partial [Neotoma lepida]
TFKRELKTKEPVIMSTLETVRIFLTEQPLEGLEKLYQEPRELPPEERAQNVTRLLRKQAEEVNTEWDKLNLHSADWQRKIDEALERLQELQEAADELNLKLRQAEVIKGSWQPVGDLLIDSLQDHLEKVKVLCFALRDPPQKCSFKFTQSFHPTNVSYRAYKPYNVAHFIFLILKSFTQDFLQK